MNNPSTKNGVFIKEFVAPTILIIAISLRLEKTLSLVVFEIIITLTVPSATTVSYTHLDVYKRQACNNSHRKNDHSCNKQAVF